MNITNEQKRKVLIISYYFPPLGMGGVQRVSKFVKYLPSFGWEPIVLTVKDIEYFSHDDSLLQELPEGIKIKRTGSLDPLRMIFLFKKLIQRKKSYGEKTNDPDPACGGTSRVALRNSKGEKAKFIPSSLLKIIDLFYFPDNKVGWSPFALINGIKLCRKEKIDLIFSTSPPLTCHLVGFLLKKITRIKWVADYRDPYFIYKDGKTLANFKKRLLKKLQKLFIKNADGFIGVTQMIASELKEICPSAKRAEAIPNGYDQEDFEQKFSREKDVFRIVYFGTFSQDCPAEPFLKSLSNVLQQEKIDRDKVKFVHVGLSLEIDMEKLMDEFKLRDITKLKGYLPHQRGIKELLKADLLLLTLAKSSPAIIPGKAYEYLGTQKPILAVVPKYGETCRLIESLGAGRVVSPEDFQGIEDTILLYYREFESGKSSVKADSDKLKKLEKKYLTSRLSQIFNIVVKQ